MFEIRVQRRRNTPAHRLDPDLPADGGFGPCPPGAPIPRFRAGCGDGRFNTPSLIEAADTVPSFHDNSSASIEDAVQFYATRHLRQLDRGQTLRHPPGEEADIVAIAALLRTLNAIDNIRNSNAFVGEALGPGRPLAAAQPLLRLAVGRHRDAIAVLTERPAPALRRRTTTLLRTRLGCSSVRQTLGDRHRPARLPPASRDRSERPGARPDARAPEFAPGLTGRS